MSKDNEYTINNENKRFDCHFFWRFFQILKILFPGFGSIPSLLFLFLLFISLLEQYVIYQVGLIPSQFYKVLGDKDLKGFWSQAILAFIIIACKASITTIKQYITSILYLSWRQILCHTIHRLYINGISFYKLNVLETRIDNPDQRITQDVDKMCNGLGLVMSSVIIVPFTMAYYSYQAFISVGIVGPLGIFGFFLISTCFNKFIMSPVVRLVFEQEKKEGDFRFKHVQIRSNSESLAFSDAANIEYLKANMKLDSLIQTQKQLVNWRIPLNLAVSLFDYVGSIISYLFLAIPIFNGNYDNLSPSDLGALISKNAFVCIYLISTFSSLVDLSVQVTDIAGNTHRIAELMEYLVHYRENSSKDNEISGSIITSGTSDAESSYVNKSSVVYSLHNVTICPPNSSTSLIKDLTLEIRLGKNILIMGPSSSGKTSFMRILKGLWPVKSGIIEQYMRSSPKDLFFFPCKPVFTDGTLRDQIIYPLRENDADPESVYKEDAVILDLLNLVGLYSLLDSTGGLDNQVDWNWYDVLSPGEMQRLCFVRLLYHCPKIAILDEATGSISLELEEIIYTECLKHNITLISIGHHVSLKKYHEYLLYFNNDGRGWSLTKLEEEDLL